MNRDIDELNDEINDFRNSHKSKGDLTRELLDKKGITSPPLNNLVQIKPGLSIQAPEFSSRKERDEWIEKMKEKYSTNKIRIS